MKDGSMQFTLHNKLDIYCIVIHLPPTPHYASCLSASTISTAVAGRKTPPGPQVAASDVRIPPHVQEEHLNSW